MEVWQEEEGKQEVTKEKCNGEGRRRKKYEEVWKDVKLGSEKEGNSSESGKVRKREINEKGRHNKEKVKNERNNKARK